MRLTVARHQRPLQLAVEKQLRLVCLRTHHGSLHTEVELRVTTKLLEPH